MSLLCIVMLLLCGAATALPIRSIKLVVNDGQCPDGHRRLPGPLGDVSAMLTLTAPLVYMCTSTDEGIGPHISSITFVESSSDSDVPCPSSYIRDPTSLNQRRFGKWLFLCVSHASPMHTIEALSVAVGNQDCPANSRQLLHDLNVLPLGGIPVHLCVLGNAAVIPEMVRLAIAGSDSKSISVSWTTQKALTDSHNIAMYHPIVQFGADESTLKTSTKADKTKTYEVGDYHHSIVIDGLLPDTTYVYRCGDVNLGMSPLRSFTTIPDKITANKPLSLLFLGDMGVTNSEATLQRMIAARDRVSSFVHVGDLSYADDSGWIGKNPKYESLFNQWQISIEPVTSTRPYMVSPGNHDVSCHSFGNLGCPNSLKNFTAYNARFRMPSDESLGVRNLWYSFDQPLVHLVSINTETDYPGAPSSPSTIVGTRAGGFGDQIGWLRRDLERASSQRHIRPWIIVYGHRPIYTSATNDFPSNEMWYTRKALEGLLLEFKVDMYICGHVHAYERHYPVANSRLLQTSYIDPPSPVYIVNGAAGNIEGHDKILAKDAPAWSAFRNSDAFGYGILDVYNATRLRWTFYKSDDGSTIDSIDVVKTVDADRGDNGSGIHPNIIHS